MRPFHRAVLLVVLLGAALPRMATAGCTIAVSHNDDPALAGSVTGDRDNRITLREAVAIADGNLRCYTDFEKSRIASANFVHDPVLCASVDNTINWRLSAGNPGCGPNDQDTIRFADNIVGGSVVSVVGGPLELDPLDSIEGNAQTTGARPDITLRGPGAASATQPGAIFISSNFAVNPASGTFKNLRFEEFRGFGILAQWVSGMKVSGVSFSRISTDQFGRADGIVLGDSLSGDCVSSIEIGGTGADQHNWFFDIAGSGLVVSDGCPGTGGDRNNKVFNNFFGMCEELDTGFGADGCAAGTTNQALGGAGVSLANATGVRVGGPGNGERNWFGRAGTAGVYVSGTNAHGNTVRGNWIGLSATQIPRANGRGVMVVNGAYGNTVGGSAAGEGNVVSANTNHGIYITSGDANVVAGNVVGLNPARTQVRGNGQDGIAVNATATNVRIRDNVVSGNTSWGIFLGASSGGVVERNVIGLRGAANNANDNTAAANGNGGVWVLEGANNAIALDNRIAGNGGPGVRITGDGADGTIVRGNVIGLDSGNSFRPNAGHGVWVESGPDATTIGGDVSARNTISGNTGSGVRIDGPGTDGTTVDLNRIGTLPSGSGDAGNTGDGVTIGAGATSVLVQNNFIAGNDGDGVRLDGNAAAAGSGAIVRLNFLGIGGASPVGNGGAGASLRNGTTNATIGGDADGNAMIANGGFGVLVTDAGTNGNQLRGNTVGGNVAALGNGAGGISVRGGTGNVVSGNVVTGHAAGPGIELLGAGTSNTSVRANRVGIDAANVASPNQAGIRVAGGAHDNAIGGTVADANIVGSNALYGLTFTDAGTTQNSAINNTFGLSGDGIAARGNGIGVLLESGASNNVLAFNTISGNLADGVRIRLAGTTGNSFQRNRIGTTVAGTGSVANAGAGVHVLQGADGNTIGGTISQGNTIRFNQGDGVWIEAGVGNLVAANAISANAGLGIDLGNDGITANDPGDGDSGANDLQNFPTLANVVRGNGMVSMSLALASTASASYVLEAFRNLACDPSGNGEAEASLGTVALTIGAGGNGSVQAMFPLADATPAAFFTASATRGSNTSELSSCATAGALPDALFANGFETGAHASGSIASGPARTVVRRHDGHVAVDLVLAATPPGAPWRSLAISANHAVAIARIATDGMACAVQGAILCEVAAGVASLELEFGSDPRSALTVTIEQRSADGALERMLLDVPAASD